MESGGDSDNCNCCCHSGNCPGLIDMFEWITEEQIEHQMGWKENTKRNSKTRKKLIGHNGQLKHRNCEMINVAAENKENF